MSETPRRIGLYGGAFDPPHLAHVRLAQTAIAHLGLDVLHITPTGQAWHKARPLSAAADRLAMCQLAFEGLDKAWIDDRELRREGPTYTVETLAELRARHPQAELVLQIGADQAMALPGWRDIARILELATVAIAVREDGDPAHARFQLDMLPASVAHGRFVLLPMPAMAHSSSEIRDRVAQGLPVDQLVGPAVARYIAQNHLYQTV